VRTRLASTGGIVALVVGLAVAAGSASAAGAACPDSNPPNELVLAGGSGQTAQLGKQFSSPLQVKLANTNGCSLTGDLAGVNVDFVAPAGGASGTFSSNGSTTAVVGTDAQGVATAPAFTANDTAGSYSVHAESDYGTVRLYLANTASGLAASIAPTGGTSQQATVDSRYPQPLQARVTDANGQPVQGATVGFALQNGPYGAGASFLTGGAQANVVTDSDGVATSPLFVANGSPGRFAAVASTDGLATVAGFSLDNHAAADTLSAVSSTGESTSIASRYPLPLAARLLDPEGQPIEGAGVTFSLGSAAAGGGAGAAGASFLGGGSQTTVLTDAGGVATSPPIVANATAGTFTATATVAGITNPLTYALRNLPARLVAADPPIGATVEHRYVHALRVRVRGADGTPLAGVTVTFAVGRSSGGATASFPDGSSQATATTDRAGIATAPPLTANGTAGSFSASATLAGSKPLRYSLRNRAGKPDAVATGAADGTSTGIGARLPIRLAVTVTDGNGNPVPGALVRFAAPRRGPGGRFTIRGKVSRSARVRTNAKGIAIAPPFTANRTAGGYAVTVRTGSRRAAFALVNRP
jgi:protocatechuate 3,4-dioxygenase beta subunit